MDLDKHTAKIITSNKRIEENFVLRSKEREEAIYLITMDPKVYGKLLTHHRRGYGVDVEALRD